MEVNLGINMVAATESYEASLADAAKKADDYTNLIMAQLGVPKRIFEGEERHSLFSRESENVNDLRMDRLHKRISERIILPLVEKILPELFWETAWICSPRGRTLKRRSNPVTVNWE